jgi:hypothetical protein
MFIKTFLQLKPSIKNYVPTSGKKQIVHNIFLLLVSYYSFVNLEKKNLYI